MNARPNIVLVHGAWADGSCWSAVIERLQADGYNVTAPQFPESSLADDVARLRQVLDRQDGPAVVAGHSYGGQIMTALGTDAPNVAGLVYIAAFGLDEGESIGGLLAQGGPPTPRAGPSRHRQAELRLASRGRGSAAHRDRRQSRPGRIASRLNRALVKEPLLVAIDFTDIKLAEPHARCSMGEAGLKPPAPGACQLGASPVTQ
jgi:pimeloyl-ACP methyl ester carboxylesterase